jgi:hypothetical protein
LTASGKKESLAKRSQTYNIKYVRVCAVQDIGRRVTIGTVNNCTKMHCTAEFVDVHLPQQSSHTSLKHNSEAHHSLPSSSDDITDEPLASTSTECSDVCKNCSHSNGQTDRLSSTNLPFDASAAPVSQPGSCWNNVPLDQPMDASDMIFDRPKKVTLEKDVSASSSKQEVDVNVAIKIQQSCAALGHHIEHCSSHIFINLRQKMKVSRELYDPSNMPQELLDGSVVGMKTVLAKGLVGQRGWTNEGKVAVVKMLLAYNNNDLLAQLGMHAHVSALLPSWLILLSYALPRREMFHTLASCHFHFM